MCSQFSFNGPNEIPVPGVALLVSSRNGMQHMLCIMKQCWVPGFLETLEHDLYEQCKTAGARLG